MKHGYPLPGSVPGISIPRGLLLLLIFLIRASIYMFFTQVLPKIIEIKYIFVVAFLLNVSVNSYLVL